MMESAGIAERIAYGRPLDPAVDEVPVRVAQRPTTALIGRILIATIFIVSGISKLLDVGGTAGYMQAAGIPAPHTLAIIAGIVEIAGGASLVLGLLTRLGALGLIVYLVIVTLTMHAFWNFQGAEQGAQLVNFLKNVAIIGGLFTVMAFGPSRYSIDKKIREPIQP